MFALGIGLVDHCAVGIYGRRRFCFCHKDHLLAPLGCLMYHRTALFRSFRNHLAGFLCRFRNHILRLFLSPGNHFIGLLRRFCHDILGLLVCIRHHLIGMSRSLCCQGTGLLPAVCQLRLTTVLRRHFHFSYFNFSKALHLFHKRLGLFPQLAGAGIRFAAQPHRIGVCVRTGGLSVIVCFSPGLDRIGICLLPDLLRICLRLGFHAGDFRFCISPQFITKCSNCILLLIACQFRFFCKHFRFLLTVFLYFIRSFLRNYQRALHGAFHPLIILQLGADPFYRIL